MAQENDILTAELIFTADLTPAEARRVQRLAKDGKLTSLYSGIYTGRLDSPPEAIVQRNWLTIAGHILPGSVISFISGRQGGPVQGVLHLTRGQRRHRIQLPGLTIEIYPGMEAQSDDAPYKSLYLASEPRWLLENLVQGKGANSRVLPQADIEAYLEKVLVMRGEHKLNELRDRCWPLPPAPIGARPGAGKHDRPDAPPSRHASCVTRGANAPALTGIGDEEFVLTRVTPGAGKAVGEDAAVEIAAEAALDIRRRRLTTGSAGELRPVRSSAQSG